MLQCNYAFLWKTLQMKMQQLTMTIFHLQIRYILHSLESIWWIDSIQYLIIHFFLNFQTLYKLNLGEYSGSGGDSLSFHSGASFTTIDKDQDTWSNNCSGLYLGGWWYRDCQNSNLNGHNYGTGESTPYGKGIVWNTFNGYYDSLKSDIMAIRPLKI